VTESSDYSPTELLACVASRMLEPGTSVFVGTGLPMIAAMLAQRTHAPGLLIIFEAGGIGPQVPVLPISVGDSRTFHRAVGASSMHDVMSISQAGYIDFGFLGAAQIDRFGNINSTVIGDYEHPKTRLPGSGGACEIAINARAVFVIMRQSKRSFVDRIDFRTSPGNLGGAESAARIRREEGWLGSGPSVVVTDMGVYHFDDTGEMRLDSIHPGVTLEQVHDSMDWLPKLADPLPVTPAPSAEELRLIREELDPDGAYTK
jgi:3-oxoacid CoA-transferase subunit B/glutaconate CoA-transferase subunit B